MFRNLPFLIEAENVKRTLFACTGKVVDGLKENFIAILKRADILHGGLHRSRCKIGDAAHESVTSGAVSEVVLDVALCKQRSSLFGIAGGEGVDEGESLFDFSHGKFPPNTYLM